MIKQRTINKKVTVTGIGLHSGKEVILSLLPSKINTGIRFQRTDLAEKPIIPAQAHLVSDTMMSSNLIQNGVKIGTVEHLLSAVSAMGIDNLLIEVSSAEIPIMDGSSLNFLELIEEVGIQEQSADKQFLKIIQPVRIEQEDKWAELIPMEEQGFELNFQIDFDHPVICNTPQQVNFQLTSSNFKNQLANARTFGFLKDIEYLRQNNLALGGSLDNAIVLDEENMLNKQELRHPDEFVRHKILDAIGDLHMIGYPILGQYNAYKSGHELNNKLIRAVLADKNSFEIVTIYDKNSPFG